MDDALYLIRIWATHGTMKQFSTEITIKAAKLGYKCELVGDTLTCYTNEKHGGVFGIGGRKVRKSVLTVIRKGTEIEVPLADADPTFVMMLSESLKQH